MRGANAVDRTASCSLEKHAIAVGFFTQRSPSARHVGVQRANLLDRLLQKIGDGLEFFIRDPDEARRSGTAITALGAMKSQPLLEPRSIVGSSHAEDFTPGRGKRHALLLGLLKWIFNDRETSNPMSISVIIPTWNEATHIAATIASLRAQGDCEILVVDGGSTDDTVTLACDADRVLVAEPGRAAQMNAGARSATREHLLFLHADCTLEPGGFHALGLALAKPEILAGCFSMCVTATGWGFRTIGACATARVRFTGIVYGDQGLFLRKRDFETLGGFPQLRFMEDVFFSRRLATRGKVIVLGEKIYVSPRRWERVGLVRQTLRNWTLTALALGGVSTDRLAEYYPRVR